MEDFVYYSKCKKLQNRIKLLENFLTEYYIPPTEFQTSPWPSIPTGEQWWRDPNFNKPQQGPQQPPDQEIEKPGTPTYVWPSLPKYKVPPKDSDYFPPNYGNPKKPPDPKLYKPGGVNHPQYRLDYEKWEKAFKLWKEHLYKFNTNPGGKRYPSTKNLNLENNFLPKTKKFKSWNLNEMATEAGPPTEIPNPFAPNMYQPQKEKDDSLDPLFRRGQNYTTKPPRPIGYPDDMDWPPTSEVTWTYNGTTYKVGPPGFSIWVWNPDPRNPNQGTWFWRDWY